MNTSPSKNSKWCQGISLLLTLGGMFCSAWFARLGLSWLLVAFFLTVFLLLCSMYITGRPMGLLINERNLMSLSRLQLVAWTVIVLSAFFTIVIARAKTGLIDDPLEVAMDWRLWALMGISTTSLVGTPLLLNGKKDKEPDPKVVPKTAADLKEPEADIKNNKEGILYANTAMSDARFTDMFQGDEIQNTARMDLAKVQMFLFTLITVFAYSAILLKTLSLSAENPETIDKLPSLPEGMIALLGISHAGYLTSKSVDHTKMKDTAP